MGKIRLTIYILALVAVSFLITFIYQKTQKSDIDYYKGHRLFERGKYAEAIKFYKEALAAKPFRLDALTELAYSCQWTGKHEEAVDAFQKALLVSPEDTRLKKSLAETYSWKKEYDKSIRLYGEVIDAKKDAETERRLAEVYIWSGRPDRAKTLLEGMLKKTPGDFKTKLLLAKALQYSARTEEAAAIYEDLLKGRKKIKAVKAPEEEKEIKQLLGEAYMIEKDYEKAIARYREVLGEEPDNVVVKEKLAEIYSWKGDYADAERLYKDIIEKKPKDPKVYAALGRVLAWDKRYREALYYYDMALSEEKDRDIMLLYAEALLYSGDYARCEKVLKEIIAEDPGNLKARTYLADLSAYNTEFKKAIKLYGDILKEKEDPDVMVKLADVLSWDKQYRESLKMYGAAYEKTKDIKIKLQEARVLSWAREYSKSLNEYRAVLKIKPDPLVELEMNAKKAYWNNRVKRAISYYEELIEADPKNPEAMFDLSQIYSYQSMWDESIGEYGRILKDYPNHFRAKEGLKKAELIAERILFKTGYEFFESDSPSRDSDICRYSSFSKLSFPVKRNFSLDFEDNIGYRTFADFSDVLENKAKVSAEYREGYRWWLDAFYAAFAYNRDLKVMHNFGGDFYFRIFDMGVSKFSYQRERLENNSTVIRGHYYADDFKERLDLDINKRIKVGMDYQLARYSDGNYKNEPGFDARYYFSLEPMKFSVKYRYFYRQFNEKVGQYFSPKGFSTNAITLDWRHYLNKKEVFFGADDLYYDLKYEVKIDSETIVGHAFIGELNWDINKRMNLNVRGGIVNSSAGVYKDKGFLVSLKYYF